MRHLIIILIAIFWACSASAMSGEGCGAGACADCHAMDKKEAAQLLGGLVDSVEAVELSEVPGLWEVAVKRGEDIFPFYVDFSKEFISIGRFVRVADAKKALIQAPIDGVEPEPVKKQKPKAKEKKPEFVDIKRIPLDDALLMGKANAESKVIVFTDPKCGYCKKLHDEMHIVAERNPEIAFLVKMYPLEMHNPEAYFLSKSIVCNKSMEFLELAFAGKQIPPAYCQTEAIDQNMALARELGIRGTPTMIMPDGQLLRGFRPAEAIETIIAEKKAAAKAE